MSAAVAYEIPEADADLWRCGTVLTGPAGETGGEGRCRRCEQTFHPRPRGKSTATKHWCENCRQCLTCGALVGLSGMAKDRPVYCERCARRESDAAKAREAAWRAPIKAWLIWRARRLAALRRTAFALRMRHEERGLGLSDLCVKNRYGQRRAGVGELLGPVRAVSTS